MKAARSLCPLLFLAVFPAFQGGDRPPRPDRDRDPPSRVGRLSYLAGSVSFRPGDVDDWTAATVNYPLHNGDHLWTDNDARAEITVGSSAFRLAPQTAFGFLALDDRTVQVRLAQGSLNVRVRDLREDESLEIDTPRGAVSLLRPGVYRFDVDSTGDSTSVTVRRGEAEVTAAGSAFPVRAEQTALVVGGDSPSYDVRDAIRPDDWEDWCSSRDRRWDDSRSARYVSRGVIGYEDLDDYGEWRETPTYGAVWVPRAVVAGWAPYRYGHWAWVEPWGWTWVDDASWGFAPFHYGRWVYVDGFWSWVPGRVVARPVYAPALVAFVGGRNWSVSIGVGSGVGVGWFPLAPEEPYIPAYHVTNTYVQNVNVTNVTNVTNITNVTNVTNVTNNTNVTNIDYRNRHAPDAVTVVSQQTFVASRPVNQGVLVVPRERLENVQVVGATAPAAPTRQSVLAQPTLTPVPRPPASVATREVVVQRQPPPAPVPFAAREAALRAHPGRPLDQTALAAVRARTPNANPQPFVRPAVPTPGTAASAPTPLRPVREGLPPVRAVAPPVATPGAEQGRVSPRRDEVRPSPAPAQPGASPSRDQARPAPRPRDEARPNTPPRDEGRPVPPAARDDGRAPRPAPRDEGRPAASPRRDEGQPRPAPRDEGRPAPSPRRDDGQPPRAAPRDEGQRAPPAPRDQGRAAPTQPREQPRPAAAPDRERAEPSRQPSPPERRPEGEQRKPRERKAEGDTTKHDRPS